MCFSVVCSFCYPCVFPYVCIALFKSFSVAELRAALEQAEQRAVCVSAVDRLVNEALDGFADDTAGDSSMFDGDDSDFDPDQFDLSSFDMPLL